MSVSTILDIITSYIVKNSSKIRPDIAPKLDDH
jgi:hypothetical protein